MSFTLTSFIPASNENGSTWKYLLFDFPDVAKLFTVFQLLIALLSPRDRMQYIAYPFPPSSVCTMSSQRTLFVTLAAQAMSSVGFSVSILAWIWLTLVPPKPELTEPILIDKKARRRSAPAALQSRKRHSTSPSVASGEAQTSPVSPQRTRRVYFIDSPTSSASRPTNFQRTSNDSSDLTLLSSPTSEISPSSSSSTLEHTYTAIPAPTLETCRESAIESDSSNSSPRPSLSLSRPFQKARPRRSSTTSATSVPDIAPIVTGPPADTKQRRSSGGLIPSWSFRRISGSKSTASPSTAVSSTAAPATSLGGCTPAVPSYFSRKTPYAYPYYAQPPTEDEGYAAYLRNLPQFSAELVPHSPVPSDSEEKEKEKEKEAPLSDQRGRNRQANVMAQAALGLGRRLPPQRSASESWAAGKDPRL
ncbi:hypothetical protein B0H14DRAFT_2676980 [Mycena olivaceomarginata]|nr:hypothetical protein B0H14DRAFT_2676980 [Mycena olivaceomarginata]